MEMVHRVQVDRVIEQMTALPQAAPVKMVQ
jgi:hypothetical protein